MENETIMQQIERADVEFIQGKAPGAFKTDYHEISNVFHSGALFHNVAIEHRKTLWDNVCQGSTSHLVPSLFTFFEDQKFLTAILATLESIVDYKKKRSIVSQLKQMYTGVNQEGSTFVVQTSRNTFARIEGGEIRDRDELGIHQIWLAATRLYEDIPKEPQKINCLAKPRSRVNKLAVYELSSIAYRLGFESEKIHTILSDQELAKGFKCWITDHDSETQVASMVTRKPVQRCGMPHQTDHNNDKHQLYIPQMNAKAVFMGNAVTVTSLFIRKSVLEAYRGNISAVDMATATPAPNFKYISRNVLLPTQQITHAFIRRELDTESMRDCDQDDDYTSEQLSNNGTQNEYVSDTQRIELETRLTELRTLCDERQNEATRLEGLLETLKGQETALETQINEEQAQLAALKRQINEEQAQLLALETQRNKDQLQFQSPWEDNLHTTSDDVNMNRNETVLAKPHRDTQFSFQEFADPRPFKQGIDVTFFKKNDHGELNHLEVVNCSQENHQNLKNTGQKYLETGHRLLTYDGSIITLTQIYDSAISNGRNTIIVQSIKRRKTTTSASSIT